MWENLGPVRGCLVGPAGGTLFQPAANQAGALREREERSRAEREGERERVSGARQGRAGQQRECVLSALDRGRVRGGSRQPMGGGRRAVAALEGRKEVCALVRAGL